MGPNFQIEGKLINLRTTTRSDLADYERWNSPKLKAFQLDGPWYKEEKRSRAVINWREEWLGSERLAPYPFLEIETKKEVHIGWVVLYHSQRDPHAPEFGVSIYEDEYWGKGIGIEAAYLWVDYLFGAYNLTRLGFCTWEGNVSGKRERTCRSGLLNRQRHGERETRGQGERQR
jgi:putative hydrolase of HD superfamily